MLHLAAPGSQKTPRTSTQTLSSGRSMPSDDPLYDRLRRAISGEPLPCALVDLDAFDANVDRCLAPVRVAKKGLRIATKSIRVPELTRRALDRSGESARGLMCYSVSEAVWLAEHGFSDLLVAYPSVQTKDMTALAKASASGKAIRIVVDSRAHLEALAQAARQEKTTCEAVVELDLAYRSIPGLHVGVRRSPLRSEDAVLTLFRAAREIGSVSVVGLMAYEAHVAGLTDANPFTRFQNPVKRLLKRLSIPAAAALRARVVETVRREGFELRLVNGGGSGSLGSTTAEPCVTEATAGSAFLAPHLFDYYRSLSLEPACFFACQVVRASDPWLVTCHGGGWVASGEAGPDRLPLPWLPRGLSLLPREGAGEVQTPLSTRRSRVALSVGDPVFFRHAKAGELAEHVNEYLLVQGDRVVGRAPTYRGLGLAFL
jgi:D-serine deaminase-like pyridoxal phosphate-dependent protein